MKIAVLLVAAAAADATSIGAHKSSRLRRRLNGTENDGGGDLFIDFDEGPPTFPPMEGPVPGAVFVMTGEDPLVGADYCAWAPAYDCYIDGWPTCCPKVLGGEPCPVEPPPCEFGALDGPVLGASYCTYAPDYDCYVDGWPSCCVAPGGEGDPCPEDRPPCELEGPIEEPSCDANAPCEVEGSECASGTESCCGETYDSLKCECMPNEDGKPTWACYATEACFLPSCENDKPVLGADYCTYGPDYDCYESGWPSCCATADGEGDPCPDTQPSCEVTTTTTWTTTTTTTETPDSPSTTIPEMLSPFPPLTPPAGGLYPCNEVIPSDYEDDIIPKDVISAMLPFPAPGLVTHDVRVHKICTSCEEANQIWEENNPCGLIDGVEVPCTNKNSPKETLPYCIQGGDGYDPMFAYGRTMSGLLFEPIDPTTKEPVVGKVAASISNYPTFNDPFSSPSVIWPSDIATQPNQYIFSLYAASSGTYTIAPDVLGNGEDWENVRSYMVKSVYQASAVPLLLKVKDTLEKSDEYGCTELDKRVNIFGYSEGGYATIAIAHALDMLDDGYVHTYTGVGGAPIKVSTEQLYSIVELSQNAYGAPHFLARLANSYSSTNNDLPNTNEEGQNFASDEYLDPDDGIKDAREWAKAGLSTLELYQYLPAPPQAEFTDILNPLFLETVLNSFDSGNNDPCNSEFKTDSIGKLCEAITDNDVSDILENEIDYPVVICHSPDDEVIYYSNVPDTSMYPHLILIEDIPEFGGLINPTGNHTAAFGTCLFGFIASFAAPSNVRSILPLDDQDEACALQGDTTTSTASTPDPDVTTTTTATTIASPITPSPTPAPESAAFAMTSLHSLTVLLAFFTAHRLR